MTARDLYEHTLTELNKLEAPSILLEDFVYFSNKAVQQYTNLTYAKFEIDQQSIDDLRVLKATTVITPKLYSGIEGNNNYDLLETGLIQDSYYVDLPEDYLHLLNCVIEYDIVDGSKKPKCDDSSADTKVYFAARNLTTGLYTQIVNNAYLKPAYNRPYYKISNINKIINQSEPTEDEKLIASLYDPKTGLLDNTATNIDMDSKIMDYNKGDTRTETPEGDNYNDNTAKYAKSNLVDSYSEPGDRLSNASTVRLELKLGNSKKYKPVRVYIDYIKSPMVIKLTSDQVHSIGDYSQTLEFPDYVCYEILNILVRLLMENASDPRLQTNMPLNNTIANPAFAKES